jgi:hypothetical protein
MSTDVQGGQNHVACAGPKFTNLSLAGSKTRKNLAEEQTLRKELSIAERQNLSSVVKWCDALQGL